MSSQSGAAPSASLSPRERALVAVQTLSFFRNTRVEVLEKVVDALEVVELSPGEVLVRQGEAGEALFLVETGELRAIVTRPDGTQIEVGRILPGAPIGEMQLMGGGVRSATVEAVLPCTLFKLERAALRKLEDDIPEAMQVAMQVTHKRLHASQFRLALPRVFGPLDRQVIEEIESKVEWVTLPRGEALFRQGDECDGWYLLLTGRLRVVVQDPVTGQERGVRDLGPGESLGEIAMITGERRTATPYAIRDSLAVRFPVQAFNEIMERHPKVLLSITRTLISVQQSASKPKPPPSRMAITVVPASSSAAVADFTRALTEGLSGIGSTRHVDSRKVSEAGVLANASKLPKDHPSWLRFSGWLEDQQTSNAFILLETDATPTGWSHRALGQADQVVIIADATDNRMPGELETELLGGEVARVRRARRTLVLVHPADTRLPSNTHEWLQLRHVDAHLHVRAGRPEDAARVARTITGRAIGLALGGGGARGYAHFGVVNALRELGVPIDVIGGTSMGSIMAGQLSLGLSMEELYALNREIIAIKPFSEYTVPMVAMLKTTGIEQSAKMAFGDTRIEDLWLPYFAVSSNLTTAEMVVHQTGPVWEATRASGSLPGIAVPVVSGNHLLVDGGVINNLPGDVMREKCGGGPVIAVNVSPEEDVGITPEGFPSQWTLFWNRFLPGQKRIQVPGILDILFRTTLLASASRTGQVQRSVDLYLRPPIDKYGTLDFDKMEELVDIGYKYTLEAAAAFKPHLREVQP